MTKRYDVVAKVISQQGTCVMGHKVGDKWVFSKTSPEGLCLGALHTLFPSLRVLMFGGSLPWSDDSDTCTVACPDAKNPLVLELRRLRK